jgi:hypothetical protein
MAAIGAEVESLFAFCDNACPGFAAIDGVGIGQLGAVHATATAGGIPVFTHNRETGVF